MGPGWAPDRAVGHDRSESAAEPVLPEIVAVFDAMDHLRHRLLALGPGSAAEQTPMADVRPAPPVGTSGQSGRLEALFFGGFQLLRDGQPVAFGQQWSLLELCRYLIAQRGRPVPRDELLEVLWPSTAASPNGLHRLHVAISAVRRRVDPDGKADAFIRLDGECYRIPETAVETDFARFDDRYNEAKLRLAHGDGARAASAFRAALEQYRGDFLADHPYAEWTHLLRDHYRERRLTTLAILCECAAVSGNPHSVIELATEILAVDNLRETAHRHLMRARYESGERALALLQYDTCARLLRKELGVSPSPLTTQLYQAVRDDTQLPREPTSVL
jgi:DNA-binding SARP family transcriptional activator